MSLAMHDDDMFQNSLVMVIICIALNVVIICQGFQMPDIFRKCVGLLIPQQIYYLYLLTSVIVMMATCDCMYLLTRRR